MQYMFYLSFLFFFFYLSWMTRWKQYYGNQCTALRKGAILLQRTRPEVTVQMWS